MISNRLKIGIGIPITGKTNKLILGIGKLNIGLGIGSVVELIKCM